VIFHFASNADVRGSFDKPISFVENNNSITINLLEAARRLNLKSTIIICSSSEVYGEVSKKDIPLREEQKFNPVNPYAATKAFQDFISQIYYKCFKLNIIITRMFSYTNARRKNLFQTAFANQIIKIKNKKQKILSHGNLDSIRTFIDINDAMDAYWLAATKGRIGEIYNIGGDKIISVRTFLKKLCSIAQLKIKTRLNKELLRPKDVTLQITDSKKFRKHTGWRPKVKFEDSVKNLLSSCEQLQKQKI
jgi:GDPmannose 4,6-dehydratase/GDP-4-dehydro-6-deoxy-D-mannose reductase